ncbi:hypothetical protein AB0E69_26585 [Kribbella sp. NPDC026611]|uniref:hypothetical protein n=1 Tax=Kribbella sp. NPDC026611 TaxID=3154911 RepID=UPI0033FBE478
MTDWSGRATQREQKPWTFYIFLGLVMAVSALTLLLRGPTHDFGDSWWSEGVSALAEGLFVASILGFTVDRLLKSILVREIAKLALTTIFGANAPQEYISNLQLELESVRAITTSAQWTIYLEWEEKPRTLKVTCDNESIGRNISSVEAEPRSPWLISSTEGAPQGYFEEYRYRVSSPVPGLRIEKSHSVDYNRDQLAKIGKPHGDGRIELPAAKLGITALPPGAASVLFMRGTSFQNVPGSFPLIFGRICLEGKIRVRGPALPDLRVEVFLGIEKLEEMSESASGRSNDGEGESEGWPKEHTFRTGFTYPGATVRVAWSPAISPLERAGRLRGERAWWRRRSAVRLGDPPRRHPGIA